MNDDAGSPLATAGQLCEPGGSTHSGCPKGESADLAKQGDKFANPYAASVPSEDGCEGATSVVTEPRKERIVVVQFSVVGMTPEARLKLGALRNCMHRMLNAAMAEWHRAEKRASSRDASKEVLDRTSVADAVKNLLVNEKSYWTKKAEELETALLVLPPKIASAKRRSGKDAAERVKKLEQEQAALQLQLDRARCRATINVPSVIYDPILRFTQKQYTDYKKDAFRGSRSNPTFRDGQPIRWRDGAWELTRTDKKGAYDLTLPVHSEDRKVERAVLKVIPDGPSMFAWAKRMTDPDELESGSVSWCDARLVYSEKKKQWFAKLTGRFTYAPPKAQGGVAALRRGVHNAFVLVFEDGDARMITGGDVIAFKRKIKARMTSVQRHLKSLELGNGARGHGKKRRQAAITKIRDAEARFVDNRCKTWAARIVKLLQARGVGRLLVAESNDKEFLDKVDDAQLQAFLRQWPFEKALSQIKAACQIANIQVETTNVGFNNRRCPQCKNVHEKRSSDVFVCDVCRPEFRRPADQILAWNMLLDLVGDEPLKKSETTRKKLTATLVGAIEKSQEE